MRRRRREWEQTVARLAVVPETRDENELADEEEEGVRETEKLTVIPA